MGAYKCARHSIQGFVIMCDHVADAIEAGDVLPVDTCPPVAGYRFVRCKPCRDDGLVYEPTQPAPALGCSKCFEAWTRRAEC